MKPLIGVTSDKDKQGDILVETRYITAVRQAGGVPVILPVNMEKTQLLVKNQVQLLTIFMKMIC